MPRKIKKYDEAIDRYGIDLLKDQRDFFGRKHPLFHRIVKYYEEKQKEEKIISKIAALLPTGIPVKRLITQLRIRRTKYYRLLDKYRKKIFSIGHCILAFILHLLDII